MSLVGSANKRPTLRRASSVTALRPRSTLLARGSVRMRLPVSVRAGCTPQAHGGNAARQVRGELSS